MIAREILSEKQIAPSAQAAIGSYFSEVVQEVKQAVGKPGVVVVGMKQNPVVRKARQTLDSAGTKYQYLEYGSYFKGWKKRLAIKLWSGWPTFPQVFIDGTLIGGNAELQKKLAEKK